MPTEGCPVSKTTLRNNARILVADADETSRLWLVNTLSQLGAQVVEVTNGKELQHQLTREGSFSLVVTQARLPAPSGLQVLANTRAARSTTPFIVITSFQRNLLRIFVSDAEGAVLSSRVVDSSNLTEVARGLLRGSNAEQSRHLA